MDDIFVFSTTVDEHFTHIKQVLRFLYNAGVTLRLAKSKFFQIEVDYLSHVIKPGKLAINPKISKTIAQAKPPTNVRKTRSLLPV